MKIKNKLVSMLVLFICSCGKTGQPLDSLLTFVNGDGSPRILFASPAMGDKNLPRDSSISVVFSEPMNISTCIQAFSLSPPITGFFDITDISLIFTPSSSWPFGSYTYTITKNCESKQGIDLKEVFSANFAIGEVSLAGSSPEVVSIEVFSGTNVSCNAGLAAKTNILNNNLTSVCMGNPNHNEIDIRFNRSMDQSSVIGAIQISPPINSNFQWITPSLLRVRPDRPFNANTRFSVNISTLASDINGSRILAPIFKSFLVGSDNLVPNILTVESDVGSLGDCLAGIGTPTNLLAFSFNNVCLGNPNTNHILFSFDRPMSRTVTEGSFSISPFVTGVFSWLAGDTQFRYDFDSKLSYGTRYSASISTRAESQEQIAVSDTVTVSFIAGGPIGDSPQVQAIGLVSQGCSNAFPGVGSPTGGNWLAPSCFWDNTLPILGPSSYTFRAGDDGTGLSGSTNACVDVTSDNIRLIFNRHMDTNTTLNAVRLRRLSPPSTIIQLSSWQWHDCQAVFPFGCRVLDLIFSEQESSCNGPLFGNAITGGDFNLLRSDNTPLGFPYYLLSVDISARDTLGIPMQTQFNFSMEAK